jgi:hypothetical protein
MSFSRTLAPVTIPQGDRLTAAMVGIGMRFAMEPARDPNIEDTLLAASEEGLLRNDFRVLSLLATWLELHSAWLNADRLFRAVSTVDSPRVLAFWAAIGHWLHKDRRLARLQELFSGPRQDLLPVGTDFQVRRRGEDPRFAEGPLRVPANVLRNRQQDILSPAELARVHRTYKYRVLMGPTYRADMWAELERDPSLSAAELARRTYGSFATAWQVKQAWQLLAA